jgi:hypothetical protein
MEEKRIKYPTTIKIVAGIRPHKKPITKPPFLLKNKILPVFI